MPISHNPSWIEVPLFVYIVAISFIARKIHDARHLIVAGFLLLGVVWTIAHHAGYLQPTTSNDLIIDLIKAHHDRMRECSGVCDIESVDTLFGELTKLECDNKECSKKRGRYLANIIRGRLVFNDK